MINYIFVTKAQATVFVDEIPKSMQPRIMEHADHRFIVFDKRELFLNEKRQLVQYHPSKFNQYWVVIGQFAICLTSQGRDDQAIKDIVDKTDGLKRLKEAFKL